MSADQLRAAAAKIAISPEHPQWLMGYAPRRSTGVRHPIFHRVLVLESGGTELVLVCSELCLVSPSLYDEAAQRLSSQLGVKRSSFWWNVTHTHAAPEVGPPGLYQAMLGRSDHEWDRHYTEFVLDKLIWLVEYARKRLAPAQVRFGRVLDKLIWLVEYARKRLAPAQVRFGRGSSRANMNRRALNVDGSISLGLNPDGPVDHEFGLAHVERPTGEPVALLVNYAMHGTVMGSENVLVSGDAPGVVMSYLEKHLGTRVLFLNGAAGDLAPIYTSHPSAEAGKIAQFNVLLGNRVVEALDRLGQPAATIPITISEGTVATPAAPGLLWPEELAAYHDGSHVLLPLRFAQLGEAAFWAAPVELFCEIGMTIREQSPFAHTFYCGYTNGWLGYLPTARAFAEGGYEPATSPFTEDAETAIYREVLAELARLAAQVRSGIAGT